MIPFNGNLFDFHSKPFSVASIDLVKRRERRGMAKPAIQRAQVGFENDVKRITRRERARATAMAGLSQSTTVAQAAVLENELLAAHVTDTPLSVGSQGARCAWV